MAVTAGYYFGEALLANGTVDAWGSNEYHELGDGATTEQHSPQQVPGVSGVTQISAGGYFTLARLSNGEVEGWGYALDGEIAPTMFGEAETHEKTAFPVAATGLFTGDGYNYSGFVIEGSAGRTSTSTLAFGSQTVGHSGPAQTATLTNVGAAPLTVSADSLSGTGSGAFIKVSDSCSGATLGAGASCQVSYTFSPTAASVVSAALSFSTNSVQPVASVTLAGTGVAPVAPAALAAPNLGTLALSPSTFRPAPSGASAVAASASTGTFVVYTDSQAATTTFLVEEKTSGVKSHGKCGVAPKHAKKGAQHCTFYKNLGSFTHADADGTNALQFTGRVGGHTLKVGSYRLSASAHSEGGTSKTQTVTFKIAH